MANDRFFLSDSIFSSPPEAIQRDYPESSKFGQAQLIKDLINSLPVVLWAVDPKGRFTISCGKGLRLLGLRNHEVVGQSLFDIYKDNAPIVDAVKRALGGESPTFISEVDGMCFETNLSPLYSGDGELLGVTGVSIDVTDRQGQARKLRENQARLEQITKLAPVGIFEADLSGRLSFVNEQWCALTGLASSEALGRSWYKVAHPEERERVQLEWARSINLHKRFAKEFRCLLPDQRCIWVLGQAEVKTDEQGNALGSIGTLTDISLHKEAERSLKNLANELETRVKRRTFELVQANKDLGRRHEERKRMLKALRTSEAKWRSLVENAPDMIIAVTRDGTIKFINRPVPPTKVEEVLGLKIFEFLEDNDQQAGHAALESVFATGKPTTFECRSVGPHGTVALYSARLSPIRSRDTVVAAMMIVTDITMQQIAQQELNQKRLELAHVSRVSNMGEMASALAHELNQPLAAIANYAHGCMHRLLAQENGGQENVSAALIEVLGEVVNQATRASETIKRIRQFISKREVEYEEFDLNEVVTNTVTLADPQSRRMGMQWHTVQCEEPLMIRGDRIQIEQVLLNLFLNGFDAMVDVDQVGRNRLTIQTEKFIGADGPVARVTITDRGSGVKSVHRNHIFEAFYSTKKEGMGMGLAISRSIVEAHTGKLDLLSSNDLGTSFRFEIPLLKEDH